MNCIACAAGVGGPYVSCVVCGLRKPPMGRSVAAEAATGMCQPECEGYAKEPCPGFLWPGETQDGAEDAE